jgi:hypothetical protein
VRQTKSSDLQRLSSIYIGEFRTAFTRPQIGYHRLGGRAGACSLSLQPVTQHHSLKEFRS